MDQQTYHVLLEGRAVGPYDRRTILGMRIKHMLTGDHLLVRGNGSRCTVRELIGAGAADADVQHSRIGTSSRAQATYTGILVERTGRGFAIPRFQGELEVRVHPDVLRLAGRYRRFLRWRDGRIKLPLNRIVQASATDTRVDIGLQPEGASRVQQLALYMFTADAAQELLAYLLPDAPQPETPAQAPAADRGANRAMSPPRVLAIAIGGLAVVIGVLVLTLVRRRLY